MSNERTYVAGYLTAYGAAKRGGYTGSYDDFCAMFVNLDSIVSDLDDFTVTITMLSPGATPLANYHDGVLSLSIPQGQKGDKGDKGDKGNTGNTGPTGLTPALSIGTVSTLEPDQDASVTITGTTDAPVLNFGIPQGVKGDTGEVTQAELDAVADDVSDLKGASQALEQNKANIDGSYDTMTVGNAKQLVSTVNIEDQVPYLFRTSGGSVDIGDREYDEIVGGSIVWNQLVQNGDFSDGTTGWAPQNAGASLSVSEGVATVTLNSGTPSPYNPALTCIIPGVLNHVYFVDIIVKPSITCQLYFGGNASLFIGLNITADIWNNVNTIKKATSLTEGGNLCAYLGHHTSTGLEIGDTISFKKIAVFDLTQMFGSTIADYIYTLETANAGAGVAWFRKLFPKPYYAYDAGEIMSVSGVSAHQMTEFNQWDEQWESGSISASDGTDANSVGAIRSKNYIPVIPGMVYYFKAPSSWESYNVRGRFYGKDKSYIGTNSVEGMVIPNTTFTIPSGCYYFRFASPADVTVTTYNHDICVNLNWDGERDGEYEPYIKRSYPLDSDLTLRGIPKLDANNDLYYDGDTYEADGTVTRRYGVVDLGTLTWYLQGDMQFYCEKADFDGKNDPSGTSLKCVLFLGGNAYDGEKDNVICIRIGTYRRIWIKSSKYSGYTTSQFKTAMSGVYLIYGLAEPTTESALAYQNPQIVDDYGTEEYVTTGIVPVGHVTKYQPNLRAKLEMAPDSPGDGDGDYIVRQTNGLNEYVKMVKELPSAPTTDGSYHLEITVASGTPTLTWVADD